MVRKAWHLPPPRLENDFGTTLLRPPPSVCYSAVLRRFTRNGRTSKLAYLGGPQVSDLERKAWQIAALEPGRFLGLRSSIPHSESLEVLARLIVSGYWNMRPRWLQPLVSVAFLEWTHSIMRVKQFAELKRRVLLPEPPSGTV